MEMVQVQERRVIVYCFLCTAGYTPNARTLTHCRRCAASLPTWALSPRRAQSGRVR